jgi:hypothetical protein
MHRSGEVWRNESGYQRPVMTDEVEFHLLDSLAPQMNSIVCFIEFSDKDSGKSIFQN